MNEIIGNRHIQQRTLCSISCRVRVFDQIRTSNIQQRRLIKWGDCFKGIISELVDPVENLFKYNITQP